MSDPEQLSASSAGRGARYVAIIADGNGRWAHERGLPLADGHTAAADTLRQRITDAIEFGVDQLVVYVFSTENWSRPAGEVEDLMQMFARRLAIEAPDLDRQGVCVRFLGRREELTQQLIAELERVQELTAANRTLELYLAFNYGGRAEIVQAAGRFDGDSEEEFRALLYAPQMQDPEVIIRTGGDQRLSNYLLWQSAYSELVFRQELWPDFTRESFRDSLRDFSDRRRRFGGREEQLARRAE
ncbi:MAG TPA: polyprenyl diphosphate synthase [Solirubrobacteraceae bacterium]|nr:polyprenyl diphosphate synthase [Solirubrobacteraceae bacterium]